MLSIIALDAALAKVRYCHLLFLQSKANVCESLPYYFVRTVLYNGMVMLDSPALREVERKMKRHLQQIRRDVTVQVEDVGWTCVKLYEVYTLKRLFESLIK